MTAIEIRPLDPSEWRSFRDFRLQALQSTPGVFATSHSEASMRGEEDWRGTIAGPGHQVFGLFDGERLVGITAAFTWNEDPSGQTALLAMSFIEPPYRGRGFSQLLYKARLDWIRSQPQFRRVIVSHRLSNEASRRANQHFGFVRTGQSRRKWPDGTTEDELHYELRL